MPLVFDDPLFPPPVAEVSDGGYIHTLTDGNIAADGTISVTGSKETGAYSDMFDNNATTKYSRGESASGGVDSEVKIDMLKIYKNAVITVYWSIDNSSTVTVTGVLETSTDDSTYTTVQTIVQTSTGETFGNYSAQKDIRYLRITQTGSAGTGDTYMRFYTVKVTKK